MTDEYKKLLQHVQRVVEREDCLLYDLEMPKTGQGRTLRVFIDKEGEQAVSLDDCSKVSKGLNLVLDVEDLISGGAYNLEVSSPGLERRLTQPWHFDKAVGETVDLHLNTGFGEFVPGRPAKDTKRKKLTAVIKGVDAKEVSVTVEEGTFIIPRQYIHKAKVVYCFENNFSHKKPKAKGRKG